MTQPSLGVQHLTNNNHLIVKQKTTFFQRNKYVVFDTKNQPLLFAREEHGLLSFGGKNRPFHMDLYDGNKQKVISCRRPYTFGPDKMEVSLCGQVVSVIRQKPTVFTPVLFINDANDRPVLRIKGGSMGTSVTCDFELQTVDKKSIGRIRKMWGGVVREMFTKSDDFHIQFPMNLDVRLKAAVLGACFLIDFLYYES